MGLVDRYLLACEVEGIEPILIISKADLGTEDELSDFGRLYASAGVRTMELPPHLSSMPVLASIFTLNALRW